MSARSRLAVLCCSLLAAGCGTLAYLGSVLDGENRLLQSVEPMDAALQDPALTDDQRAKLAFIVRARDYARQVVGLNVGDSFQSLANLGTEPLAWNLSGSLADAFQPYLWYLPFAGELPYVGFFDFDQAVAERDRLVDLGYDTLVYEVDAFSTLGLLPDPVASPLLRRDEASLADTVMHELLHNTIYKADDSTFNESLATFVGRTAGIEFLQHEFGPDAPQITQAREGYDDSDRFNSFLQELTAELNVLYDTDKTTSQKLHERQNIFEGARQGFTAHVLPLMHDQDQYSAYSTFEFNNAFLLLNVRYNYGLDVFERIYEHAGRNWSQALPIFSDAAASADPIAYLQGVLGE